MSNNVIPIVPKDWETCAECKKPTPPEDQYVWIEKEIVCGKCFNIKFNAGVEYAASRNKDS